MMVHLLQIPLLPACSLGCYGEQRFATPCFDTLAAQSTVFNHYYSNDELAFEPSEGLTVHRWAVPEPELDRLLNAAECWLNAEQWQQLLSTESHDSESHDSAAGSVERLWDVCPKSLHATVQATALALTYDDALGEWVDGMSFSPNDVLMIVGQSGDVRRRPESCPAWLAEVSEPVVHLPLLIHQIGQQEHQRVEEAISTKSLLRRVRDFALRKQEDQQTDLTSFLAQSPEEEILWDLPNCRARRSKDWLIVERLDSTEEAFEQNDVALFRKPEDLWDLLNVASQHPERVERSLDQLRRIGR